MGIVLFNKYKVETLMMSGCRFQGPVLSAHKKLVAEKLAEEETERKVKGEAKKEKHLVCISDII